MNRTVLFTMTVMIISLFNLACQTSKSVISEATAPMPTAAATPTIPLPYEDLVVGDGLRAMWGGTASVKYVGKLTSGLVFDQGKLDFKLGDQNMIKGFNLGVGGSEKVEAMRVGGKRKIVVPPELGYGANGNGNIPPNATLTFEIELLKMQGGIGF